MQCPFSNMFCEYSIWMKILFYVLAAVSFLMGLLSLGWPDRSIRLYQWMMERFNWRVFPINEAREITNTKHLGIGLILLGLALAIITLLKF